MKKSKVIQVGLERLFLNSWRLTNTSVTIKITII